jgi:hypothetical protein
LVVLAKSETRKLSEKTEERTEVETASNGG